MSIFQQNRIQEFLSKPFLLLLITILFSTYFLIKKLYKNPSNKNLPPSPPRLPILGNLHQLSPLSHRSFQSFVHKYGPVMLLHLGSRPVILIQSSQAAREVMKTNDLVLADKAGSNTTRKLFYDMKTISVSPYGEYWRKLKSICVLQLLSHKRVQDFQSIRQEETALLVEKIKASLTKPVNLSEAFMSLTSDVICRAAFGRKYSEGEDGKRFLMVIKELLEVLGCLSIGEYIPCLWWINRVNGFDDRVDRVAREIDGFLEKVVQEREINDSIKDGSSGENFVDILLGIYKDGSNGFSMHRDSIKAILLDMLGGGTDTTSATIEWAMTELLRHPIIMNTLKNEVSQILKNKHDITDDDLEKMHYLKAVVKETLRCHPPITFMTREARENVTIMGYDIEPGTMFIINGWAIGRDPLSWNEPETFHPERFMDCSIDYKGQDFELIPFGSGRRGCPGIGFAMASVELVLANLVHKFEWELPDGMKSEELDTIENPGVTIHRKNALFAVPTQCYF